MASIYFFSLTFLILSCSITFGTVDIFQSQAQSACESENATVTCVTVVTGGLLEWSIDDKPLFSVGSGQNASMSETIDGSTFVFIRGIQLDGNIYTYTSTATFNSSRFSSITCSDGIVKRTLVIRLTVEGQPSDLTTGNNVNDTNTSVIMSWTPPAPDNAICCVGYNLMSSNGNSINSTATSVILYNIVTKDNRENAFILVRCMDRIGTMGPEIMYRPIVGFVPANVSNPEHVGYSGYMPMYEVTLYLPIPSESDAIALVTDCSIEVTVNGSDRVVEKNCDIMRSKASFTISDLSPFTVEVTFSYGLGFNFTQRSSPLNGLDYDTRTLIDARRAQQISGLYVIIAILATLLLITIIIVIVLIIIIIIPKGDKPVESHELKKVNSSEKPC